MRGLFFFTLLLFAISSPAHQLELLVYRAPQPIDWSSPGNLVRSMMRNQTFKVDGKPYPHTISHVNLRLQCGSEPPLYRGMTSIKSNASYLWDFIIQGSSLDTLLINQKGRSYTQEEILKWLPRLKELGYVRTFKILLNPEQCHRAQKYLHLYQETGLGNIYGGLRSDPLKGQGAGCSAFVVSLLQVLNLAPDKMLRHWRRELAIPLELLSSQEKRARISFLGYLRGRDRGWATSREEKIQLLFWDPELMFKWIGGSMKTWDARSARTPHSPFFAFDRRTHLKTVSYHYHHRKRLLTKEEILNISSLKCRNFQVCD